MEHLRAAFRVDAGQVWAFMQITMVAGEGQVVRIIRTAMLTGDDVVNRKGRKGLVLRVWLF